MLVLTSTAKRAIKNLLKKKTNKQQKRTRSLSNFDTLTNITVTEGFFNPAGSLGEVGIKESS